jgi:hypothetical protein
MKSASLNQIGSSNIIFGINTNPEVNLLQPELINFH